MKSGWQATMQTLKSAWDQGRSESAQALRALPDSIKHVEPAQPVQGQENVNGEATVNIESGRDTIIQLGTDQHVSSNGTDEYQKKLEQYASRGVHGRDEKDRGLER